MLLKKTTVAILVAATLAISGCADYTNQKVLSNQEIETDPGEGFNRVMYNINLAIDTVILKPVTMLYRFIVPEPGREMVSNFVDNLASPVYMANSVLQGDFENSMATLFRFTINTTWGIGGLFDVAEDGGLLARRTNFGDTLTTYGVGSGPYVYLPIFGPGTMRDQFGRIVDIFFNPTAYANSEWEWVAWTQAGLTAVDARSRNFTLIEDIYRSSLDPYATFRSGYLQKRAAETSKLKKFAEPTPATE